jgi:hypothetical protein
MLTVLYNGVCGGGGVGYAYWLTLGDIYLPVPVTFAWGRNFF